MRNCGKWVSCLLLSLVATVAQAALQASVDRASIALGDTLQLTITTDGDEELRDLQLGPLNADFEILSRATRSSMNIINGKRSHERSLVMELSARREGKLVIPALRLGSASTRPIPVLVAPAAQVQPGDEVVLFDAELDRDSVYVQGQLLLTLRLQQAVNLESRSITELRLDNAFVKQLGQNSFQRNAGGRVWLVHEIRYAIFPEQSGTLTIPPQTFTARQSDGRRGLFSSGRQLRRNSEPLSVEVLPRPASYGNHAWLPAKNLRLEEEWSVPPEQLRAGESATRTIRIYGEGLQGAQLPPVLFPATAGLKYYPDQPVIEDRESATGLVGVRRDSAALVPIQAGRFRVPEVRIPWFDTESGEVREAVLPARELRVAPAEPGAIQAAPQPSAVEPAAQGDPVAQVPTPAFIDGAHPAWRWATIASVAGWLATLAWVWRGRRRAPASSKPQSSGTLSERNAFKNLAAACASGDAAGARHYLAQWGAAALPGPAPASLGALADALHSPELRHEVALLERALYSPQGGAWDGAEMIQRVKSLRRERPWSEPERSDDLRELYPAT